MHRNYFLQQKYPCIYSGKKNIAKILIKMREEDFNKEIVQIQLIKTKEENASYNFFIKFDLQNKHSYIMNALQINNIEIFNSNQYQSISVEQELVLHNISYSIVQLMDIFNSYKKELNSNSSTHLFSEQAFKILQIQFLKIESNKETLFSKLPLRKKCLQWLLDKLIYPIKRYIKKFVIFIFKNKQFQNEEEKNIFMDKATNIFTLIALSLRISVSVYFYWNVIENLVYYFSPQITKLTND